jgi:hypothetical protein
MRAMHAPYDEDDEDALMVDRATLPARGDGGPRRRGVRGLSALAWSVMGLIFCLAVIAVGALVLQHLGLEGVRPIDPRDAYFNP